MTSVKKYLLLFVLIELFFSCKKKTQQDEETIPISFAFKSATINDQSDKLVYYNINNKPVIKFFFAAPINKTSLNAAITFKTIEELQVSYNVNYENGDSVIIINPAVSLGYLTKYTIDISRLLKSIKGSSLQSAIEITFTTQIDPSNKFTLITDDELLTKIQQQTFKYFWDYAHPVSGLARERSNGDGNVVTSGGSGFGVMAIITGIHRNFITRQEGLQRIETIVAFLKNTAQRIKGAYPHWLNGATGVIIPFSEKDNGADLVETSYLMQGLLCARQYFNGTEAEETALRADINNLWQSVEWSWFTQNDQNVLYWHWSSNYGWAMNMQIKGWNECLVTYVLAASSPTHTVSKEVYDNGWASNGGIRNGNKYYNYVLPLGEANGGPLFFEHYSFLGVKPEGLLDAYADYGLQTKNHTLINYNYCIANPKKYYGYSDSCWGLTASDIKNGYIASSPTNDVGVIAPTAAISSLPYTPEESMKALKFFYYRLGDKIWKDYGFVDAFSLNDLWFADSFLAIDQGSQIVMIENYRSGLCWNLFMSCPEIKQGMKSLGFTGPGL